MGRRRIAVWTGFYVDLLYSVNLKGNELAKGMFLGDVLQS